MSKPPRLDRDQTLGAKPLAAPIVRRTPLPRGGERLTVAAEPSIWTRRLLRLPRQVERQFELDAFGVEMIRMCDGQKTVRWIIDRFSRNHQIDAHEAERAVLTFLRTIVGKGLVSMVVAKRPERS